MCGIMVLYIESKGRQQIKSQYNNKSENIVGKEGNSIFHIYQNVLYHFRVCVFLVLHQINSISVIYWQQFINPCFLDYF